MSVFVPVPCCFDYHSFSDVRESGGFSFVLFFSRLLSQYMVFGYSVLILGLFVLVLVKNALGILIGIALNL